MDREIDPMKEAEEIFKTLRSDVRDYFERHEMLPCMYNEEKVVDIRNKDVLNKYIKHKFHLSLLCGFDAIRKNPGNYDQEMYDKAFQYLCLIMGL
ncbi:MAG: hypothetical protein QXI33_02490 [Candidatus Pacearchaeota archaeon]